MLDRREVRYLLAGGWNTLFGYFCGVALYLLLSPILHIVLIAVIANMISITMSFATYKLFVFRTKGNWLNEYFKSYIVYGAAAVVSITLLWVFVDAMGINIWIGQAVTIGITVVISYFGHTLFTFKRNKTRGEGNE